jgi:hypothetical protein
LLHLGYPVHAAELYQAAMSRPEQGPQRWKEIWQNIDAIGFQAIAGLPKPSYNLISGTYRIVSAAIGAITGIKDTVPFEKVVADVVKAKLAVTNEVERKRSVNVWIEGGTSPVPVEMAATLGVDIGPRRNSTETEEVLGSQPFRDPPWGDRQSLDLLVGLIGPYVTVEPSWQKVTLPRQGIMNPIFFTVVPNKPGNLELTLSFRLPKSMTLLQEYRVEMQAYVPAEMEKESVL